MQLPRLRNRSLYRNGQRNYLNLKEKDTNSNNPSVTIRPAQLEDVEAITEIYNEAILTTTATFDTEPKDVVERADWLKSHDGRHPVLVAQMGDRIVGWSALSRWSERRAYDDTAETSFYVKSEFRGRGIGRKLKQATIEEARRLGFHTLIARVAEGSEESIHLNESMGFVHIGMLKEVGRKFNRLIGVHILQKMLGQSDETRIAEPRMSDDKLSESGEPQVEPPTANRQPPTANR
jgi:L-amino acid N-acyltransferase